MPSGAPTKPYALRSKAGMVFGSSFGDPGSTQDPVAAGTGPDGAVSCVDAAADRRNAG